MATTIADQKADIRRIPVKDVRDNPDALRGVSRRGEEFPLLKASIAQTGLLYPITVREMRDASTGQEYYSLIDGLQRFTACSELGHSDILARVLDTDEAGVLEAQIVANLRNVKTKPAEFAHGCKKMLLMNPTMTSSELAQRLSITQQWLDKTLKLNDLTEDVKALVDSNQIPISNGAALALLPVSEQLNYVDRAQTMGTVQFTAAISSRLKEIRAARREGRDPANDQFKPVPTMRKLPQIKDEYENPVVCDSVLKDMNASTAKDGWVAAITWVLNMDPKSQQEAIAKEARRIEIQKEAAEKRKRERAEQKMKDAAMAQQDILHAASK